MKIRELREGESVKITLAVLASEIKPNKNKQDQYLALSLYDGTDTITGNMWSYNSPYIPQKNTVVDVTAKVGSWQGNKQLTISSVELNSGVDIMTFMPQGDIDINEYVAKADELIDSIQHAEIRHIVRSIYNDNNKLLKSVPAAKSIHHAFFGGTLMHHVETAIKAKAIGQTIPGCQIDLCVAGALLHDIGKLWTYMVDGVVIDYTLEGRILDHIAIGLTKLEAYKTGSNNTLVILLQHIIAAHHGQCEYGSPVTPRFLEAWIVCYADGIDAKAQTILQLNKGLDEDEVYTKKEWALENAEMLTMSFIAQVLNNKVE